MIKLYFWPTPNGKKVSVMLEEVELPYEVVPVNIGRGDQFAPAFLDISPNNRMPAIIDDDPPGDGGPLSIFESGAILMYLADKSGRLWPKELHRRYEVAQWVMWQMSNQGPKFGENGHFKRALAAGTPEVAYGRKRFDDEVNRLYGVMNQRLSDRRYLAGSDYSIADVISYPWASLSKYMEQNLDDFVHVKRWLDEIGARPAVQRGMAVGASLSEDPATISAEEKERRAKVLHDQRARPLR